MTRIFRRRPALLLAAWAVTLGLAMPMAAPAHASPDLPDPKSDPTLSIKVKKTGGKLIVDLIMLIPASPQQTWEVLTDYDHMTRFITNLQSSKITQSSGNKV